MQVAVSILSITEQLQENIKKIEQTDCEYFHLDIMDGIFVKNHTMDDSILLKYVQNVAKPIDIHLMVSNIPKYVDIYQTLHPKYITFHYEATNDIANCIQMIKAKGIGVGVSVKPSTPIFELMPYLQQLDLVLVMSVEPGQGGQTFIGDVVPKIEQLKTLREQNAYHYMIEVDGGINAHTVLQVQDADIVVAGSFITKENNYQGQIDQLRR